MRSSHPLLLGLLAALLVLLPCGCASPAASHQSTPPARSGASSDNTEAQAPDQSPPADTSADRSQADAQGDLPTRDTLTDFRIDGQPVTRAEYEARLDTALDGALELDRDWAVDPVTAPHLEALFAALEAEAGDYLLPDSDAVYLTAQDLAGLSGDQLRLARNEIFARQGRTFQDQALQDYFDQKDWYVAIYTPEQLDALASQILNRYEAANLALIQSLESGGQQA